MFSSHGDAAIGRGHPAAEVAVVETWNAVKLIEVLTMPWHQLFQIFKPVFHTISRVVVGNRQKINCWTIDSGQLRVDYGTWIQEGVMPEFFAALAKSHIHPCLYLRGPISSGDSVEWNCPRSMFPCEFVWRFPKYLTSYSCCRRACVFLVFGRQRSPIFKKLWLNNFQAIFWLAFFPISVRLLVLKYVLWRYCLWNWNGS